MPIIETRAARERIYDLCVVGGGPAGLALALDCAERGLAVALVESGGAAPSAETDDLSFAEIEAGSPHGPMNEVCCRALGGASHWWGRRCVPFDPIDFLSDGDGRWPLDYAEAMAWLAGAAEFLGCGDGFAFAPPPGWEAGVAVRADQHERWSAAPDMLVRHRPRLLAEGGPSVLLNATALGLDYERSSGSAVFAVSALRIRCGGEDATVRAKRFALAGGGLETTRLLLSEQRLRPDLFGGAEGVLGRFYMGHLTGSVARLAFSEADDARHFDFRRAATGEFVRRFLTLPAETHAAAGIGNIGFWIANPPRDDPSHGSAFLSLKHLLMARSWVNGRPVPAARRRAEGGDAANWRAHGGNIARDPLGAAAELGRAAARKLRQGADAPGRLARTKDAAYALHYHAEQAPRRESRVELAGSADPLGLPRLRIDYRVADADVRSVLDAHEALGAALQLSGKAKLRYLRPMDQVFDHIRRQARDGYHQIGMTRMSDDPDTGVVDRDCRAHDFDNLFVASSSVFPSSGRANPTFTIVSLALRLAAHVAGLDAAERRGASPRHCVRRPA